MQILIACEESQVVCKAFRDRGFEAFSCDLQDCSGGHPEWHIKDNVLNHLNDGWDLMIGHPDCTYLCNSGVSWMMNKDGSVKNRGRFIQMMIGTQFFKALLHAPIPHIAIENPIPHKYAIDGIGRKYDQIIQPYQFGHLESKATCLWLKNLPLLQGTNDVKSLWKELPKKLAQKIHYMSPGPERAKMRSKTFTGIGEAMAKQWGDFICGNTKDKI